MKRSIFLLITAIFAAIFGGMMFFLPGKMADGFGSAPTLFSTFLMREMGLIILCSGVLNFLVRNDRDSLALKAIFIFQPGISSHHDTHRIYRSVKRASLALTRLSQD